MGLASGILNYIWVEWVIIDFKTGPDKPDNSESLNRGVIIVLLKINII